MLGMAAKAKLDVVGMNVEPSAIVDCFAHIYRRKSDAHQVSLYIDIGYKSSRAIIAQGSKILFARVIPVGGEHFNRVVAQNLGIGAEEAKLLRIKLCQIQPSLDPNRASQELKAREPAAELEEQQSFALLGAGVAKAQRESRQASRAAAATTQAQRPAMPVMPTNTPVNPAGKLPRDPAEQIVAVEEACHEPLTKLIQELDLCRRYHEATFPSIPVERLVFVGGEAKQRRLCQGIARELGVAAQVGDPLVRMGRVSEVGIESGIDRRQPQPGWATAIGLSLGPIDGGAPMKG
jgi:Tfp pilus assembly PilM family ATPase